MILVIKVNGIICGCDLCLRLTVSGTTVFLKSLTVFITRLV